jgi:hypothetical protein
MGGGGGSTATWNTVANAVIDVTESPYTADPTGTTDSTTTIQAALDAGRNGVAVVYFPTGVYKISGELNITDCHLKGVFHDAAVHSVIRAAQGATINRMLYATGNNSARVEDLVIDASYDDNATHRVAEYCIHMTTVTGVGGIRNVWCKYADTTNIYLDDCEVVYFQNINSTGAKNRQWHIKDCNGSKFERIAGTSVSDSTEYAVYIEGDAHGAGVCIDTIDIEGTGGPGALKVEGTTVDVVIRYLYTEHADATAADRQDSVYITGCNRVVLDNCYISAQGNGSPTDTGASTNYCLNIENSYNCVVRDSSFVASNDSALVQRIKLTGTTAGTKIVGCRQPTGAVIDIAVNDATGLRQHVEAATIVGEFSGTLPTAGGAGWAAGDVIRNTAYRSSLRPTNLIFDNRSHFQSVYPIQIQSVATCMADLVECWDVRTGLTITSGAVSAWEGSRGTSLAQGTAGSRPTYTANGGINNLHLVRFDGTDDFLTTTLGSSLNDFTLYAVAVPRSGYGTTSSVVCSFGSFAPELYLNSGIPEVYHGSGGAFDIFGGALAHSQPYVWCVWRSGADYRAAIYSWTANGGLSGGVSFSTRTLVSTATSTSFQVCSETTAGSNYGKNDIYYISIHNTVHDDAERNLMKNYLFGMMGM